MRARDRESSKGLLPRMEARPRKDGQTTYRYHPVGGKPLNLGTDRLAAIQQVLDLLGISDDRGTIAKLWEQYKESASWAGLRPRTREDYADYSAPLLKVFGSVQASEITAPDVARYLRQERKAAPIRANREVALLGNLISLAIERGEATANPCRGGLVKRNMERSSDVLPEEASIDAVLALAEKKAAKGTKQAKQWRVVMLAAEFAALTGARQIEFLSLHWPAFGEDEVRMERGKQREGVKKVDRIAVSTALADVRKRLLDFQRSPMGAVFPTRTGNPYTASGFASMWQKLSKELGDARFNFHALRAYYTTRHKTETGSLPEIHASPTTTAKVYERSKSARRKAL